MSAALTCKEFTEFLADYLSGEMSLERRAVFDDHLARCPMCVLYLNSYRATVQMGRAVFASGARDVPDEVPEDLVRAVVEARRRGQEGR